MPSGALRRVPPGAQQHHDRPHGLARRRHRGARVIEQPVCHRRAPVAFDLDVHDDLGGSCARAEHVIRRELTGSIHAGIHRTEWLERTVRKCQVHHRLRKIAQQAAEGDVELGHRGSPIALMRHDGKVHCTICPDSGHALSSVERSAMPMDRDGRGRLEDEPYRVVHRKPAVIRQDRSSPSDPSSSEWNRETSGRGNDVAADSIVEWRRDRNVRGEPFSLIARG